MLSDSVVNILVASLQFYNSSPLRFPLLLQCFVQLVCPIFENEPNPSSELCFLEDAVSAMKTFLGKPPHTCSQSSKASTFDEEEVSRIEKIQTNFDIERGLLLKHGEDLYQIHFRRAPQAPLCKDPLSYSHSIVAGGLLVIS